MRNPCHIRHLTKRWNSRWTWNLCFIFNFQLKKIRSKIIQITLIVLWSFISFELRHLNSMKMSQKAKFGCSIFQLKIKRKQIFQVRQQFGHFVKCRIEYDMNRALFAENSQILPKISVIPILTFMHLVVLNLLLSGAN